MHINDYKAAVGKFPTGVTVIATSANGRLYGFTANSFTSVSLSPTIVSFCLEKKANSVIGFEASEHFIVNILAHDQESISTHFSQHIDDKFKLQKFLLTKYSTSPVIEGVVSYLECKKIDQITMGDHFIFFGNVINAQIINDKDPLIYFSKRYTNLCKH